MSHKPNFNAYLKKLSIEDKVKLVSGESSWRTHGIEAAGIPILKVSDGPNGVRGDGGVASTCFPVGICMAASWNLKLLENIGAAIAQEAKDKGVHVVLGPTINLHRTPLGGRNFECYSEDPLLSGELAAAFTSGVQQHNIGACLKHFVCNDSEFQRHTLSVNIDERSLREIYLRPFEIAIQKSKPWTVMAAYNRINGIYACSHNDLINNVLKQEWGFEGLVMSDWYAAKETVPNALGGLDLEMPGPAISFGKNLLKAVATGEVKEAVLDKKIKRLLQVLDWANLLRPDGTPLPTIKPEVARAREAHQKVAYQAAIEGMVLLKNNHILPLQQNNLNSLAIIGPNSLDYRIMGGGSSALKPHAVSDPIQVFIDFLPDTEIFQHQGCHTYKYIPLPDPRQLSPEIDSAERGLRCHFFKNLGDEHAIAERTIKSGTIYVNSPFEEGAAASAATIEGYYHAEKTGIHQISLLATGHVKLCVDGKLLINCWGESERQPGDAFFQQACAEKRVDVFIEAGNTIKINIAFNEIAENSFHALRYGILPPQNDNPIMDAAKLAAKCDKVILLVGTNDDWETEGNDREMLNLPGDQDQLIQTILEANPNTVIVNNSGSPISMPWIKSAPAVLQTWFAGQEFGAALRDILFGIVNPSGKLPISFPCRMEDTPAYTTYPGEFGEVRYGESIFIGYRWYSTRDIKPLFPFGHGLSYTNFEYADFEFSENKQQVSLVVKNTGGNAGQETVQIYAHALKPSVAQTKYKLIGFTKVTLDTGEHQMVSIELDDRAFDYWDSHQHKWLTDKGQYQLIAASSLEDHRLTIAINR